MIPITIQSKKYSIKSIDEINAKEFIELMALTPIDSVKYIAWQTGLKLEEAFFCTISKAVEKGIGQIPDISKLPKSKLFDYSKLIDTIGQRHQIEQSKLSEYELIVFCLAVSQAQSFNIDEVQQRYDEYLELPFKDVFAAGFFFCKNLEHGRSKGLRRLMKQLFLTKTKS